MKAVLRGKFVAVNAYVKKQDLKSTAYLPNLTEVEEQTNQSKQKKGNNKD